MLSNNLSATFQRALDLSEQIQGSHSPVSTAIFTYFASLLPSSQHALELGVWKGKSAAVLACLFPKVDLVDVSIPSELDFLRRSTTADISFTQEWSYNWLPDAISKHYSYDFIHLDTSHTFKDTLNELEGVSSLAQDHSILVLDDWNEIYPTVQTAYYYYRFVTQGRYELFLVAYNKAYLCTPRYFDYYASKINSLRSFLHEQNYLTHIARTSDVPEYRAFLVRPVEPPVEEYYGGRDNALYQLLDQRIEKPDAPIVKPDPEIALSKPDDSDDETQRHHLLLATPLNILKDSHVATCLSLGDKHARNAAYAKTVLGCHATASDCAAASLSNAAVAINVDAYVDIDMEHIPYGDHSIDLVLCKQALHTQRRPLLALYEMIRVARRFVVLIEPYDCLPTVSTPYVEPGQYRDEYQGDSCYQYKISLRETLKVAWAMGLPAVVAQGMNDPHHSTPSFEEWSHKKAELDRFGNAGIRQFDLMSIIILKQKDDLASAQLGDARTYIRPENPFMQ